MTVISLAEAREERTPHWNGTVQCLACRHEWEAVAPVGTNWLECPECKLPQGHPKYPFGASEGDLLLTCSDCAGEAFTAYKRKGHMWVRCMGCGTDVTEAFYS